MKPISKYIRSSLSNKSQHFDEILNILRACLPESCHSHMSIAKIDNRMLLLVTDSAVWASRLRLYSSTMLEMIKLHSRHNISQIKISQVQTRLNIQPNIKKVIRTMDIKTGQLITQTADYINDKSLQEALLKLAKRAK